MRDRVANSMDRNVVADTAYVHYEKTIDMLNKTLGICLPLR